MYLKILILSITLYGFAQYGFSQNERLFIGIEIGGSGSKSFQLKDSNSPYYFHLNKFSYEEYLGFHLVYRFDTDLRIRLGYNYFTFTESYSLGSPSHTRIFGNGQIAMGYIFHHFPLLIEKQILIVRKPKFNLFAVPRLGFVYSRSEDVDLNAGNLTTIANRDTISTNYGDYDYGILLTRNNILPKIGLGLELEYYNKRNKVRKIQINVGYAIGIRKLHTHIIGSSYQLTKTATRGTFMDLNISYFLAVSDLIPKKKRISIKSGSKDKGIYRLLYLP
jgi:hypothetical protein